MWLFNLFFSLDSPNLICKCTDILVGGEGGWGRGGGFGKCGEFFFLFTFSVYIYSADKIDSIFLIVPSE